MLAPQRLKPLESLGWSMRNALFGSKPENNAMQDLVDLCYETIGFEQQVVSSDVEEQILDIMGAHCPISTRCRLVSKSLSKHSAC